MASAFVFVALFSTFVASIWLYIQYSYSYWKRKGIPYLEPSFPFGTFKKTLLQRSLLAEELKEMYEKTTEPFIGLYSLWRPYILIRDPALIRDILIKDFSSFHNRGWHVNVHDKMANNLLVQTDEKWKHSRTKLSPAFTTGKLKGMFETIVKCGDSLEAFITKVANSGKSVEVREMFARFATNAIASVGFGIEIDCLKEPENEFRKYGRKFFDSNVKNGLRNMAFFLTPELGKLFRSRFADRDVGDFMIETVKQTLEYREKNNVIRKDFIQLLMQLRNGEQIQDNNDWTTTKNGKGTKFMSIEEMAAQAHLFLIGGFESNSTTMSFCLYELARNPEKQQKAYEDIVTVLEKYDDKLTYDAMAEMKYMEKCIEETLRMHAPFGFYTRECTKDYRIANSNAVIEKGTFVMISASGIHHDTKYYENPNEFIPERFMGDKTFLEMPFLAFGDGPRNCIAMRLGKMQAKIGVILMLKKFRFELGEEHTNRDLEIDPISQARAPKNGINLKVFSRQYVHNID